MDVEGFFPLLAALLCLAPVHTHGETLPPLQVAAFSLASEGEASPENWQPLTFDGIDRHTDYRLIRDGDTVVVMAWAQASGSGLTRALRFSLSEYPVVRWRWRIANTLKTADIARQQGDDASARLLIFFAYEPGAAGLLDRARYEAARILYGAYPPHSGITYVWDNTRPPGTVLANPYARQVKMIVVESGDAKLNQWVEEERNVYADYRAAFGAEPPPVLSIAIMTDTDVTRETATAYYGDIVFKPPP